MKDRNRRTQRVAGYVRSSVSLANFKTSVNAPNPTESLDDQPFQSNYEINNLKNK